MRILSLNGNSRSIASKNQFTHLLLLLSFSFCVSFNTATAQLTDSIIQQQLAIFYESNDLQDLYLLKEEIFTSKSLSHDLREILHDYLRLIEACRNTVDSPRFKDAKPFSHALVPVWLFPDKVFPRRYPPGIDPAMIADAELRTAYLVEIKKNNLRLKNSRFIWKANLFIMERAAEFEWIVLKSRIENSMTLEEALLIIEQSNLKEKDQQDLITRLLSWE